MLARGRHQVQGKCQSVTSLALGTVIATEQIRIINNQTFKKTNYEMATVINDNNYKSLLESGKPVVIDFWAPWCGPCRSIAPIIEELATAYEDRVIIGKYNVDDDTDLGVEYGIRNIPTLLFFDKEGKMVDKHVGTITQDALTAKIEALL
jgi:thioredoxin 1